ncbi:hypothetical protein B484DRAFT_397063 [Ochromonadaceae sp. CCMP2298]|nr:hypothetical protein B484DRAFT_143885 [Ochromonadaceae sp. CCMP2298]KAJ1427810.1 hypothetical protein B484DRAFT_397063 [Ochromonadaceae sp. CCMP2298]
MDVSEERVEEMVEHTQKGDEDSINAAQVTQALAGGIDFGDSDDESKSDVEKDESQILQQVMGSQSQARGASVASDARSDASDDDVSSDDGERRVKTKGRGKRGKGKEPKEGKEVQEVASDASSDASDDDVSSMGASDDGERRDKTKGRGRGKRGKGKDPKEVKELMEPKEPKEGKEVQEVKKLTAVEGEIAVTKQLDAGPSEAELRRRDLIEIDQDELEERLERANRRTLRAMGRALGLSKAERYHRIVECREFLKTQLGDADMADFIEETVDKLNDRTYGDGEPTVDALDYLDKAQYSDDDEDLREDPDTDEEEEVKAEPVAVTDAVQSAGVGAEGEGGDEGGVFLSDSEDEDVDTSAVHVVVFKPTTTPSPPQAVDAATVKASLLGQIRLQEDANRERDQQRKERFLAARAAPQNSRSALLIQLRQKVSKAAKENYCHQRRISTEQLATRLQVAEKCRVLVELLKVMYEGRDKKKREERRAKYVQQAGADEDEFDEEDVHFGEGQYVTAAEKAALMNGDSDSESDSNYEDEEEMAQEEAMDIEVGKEEEEKEEGDKEAGEQGGLEGDVTQEQGASQAPTQMAEEEEEEVQVRSRVAARATGGTEVRYGRRRVVAEDDMEEEGQTQAQMEEEGQTQAQTEEQVQMEVQTQAQETETQAQGTQATSPAEAEVETEGAKGAEEEALGPAVVDGTAAEEGAEEDLEEDDGLTVTGSKERRRKKKSTGNSMFRLAMEEEERRHRKAKKNTLVDDEAEEEEEEGQQAGLGDFGFGVTSKIRENDDEQNALKYRKGDFDHIVDQVSDGEGDEEEGDRARAAMELQEDKLKDLAIIKAVTEGHDASRRKKNKYSFDKLVGDEGGGRRRRRGEAAPEGEEEEEYDEEEMLQRGMMDRFEREKFVKGRRGGSDSDSDSAGSDEDENMLEALEGSDMTDEQKAAEIERLQRLREKSRTDALMARQRIQSYKMARERLRLEKGKKALQALQNASQGVPAEEAPMMRQSSFSLEPLHDEYSRLHQSTQQSQSANVNGGGGNGGGEVSPRALEGKSVSFSSSSLADITNQPKVKRRTTMPPKRAGANTRPGERGLGGGGPVRAGDAGLYRGELNQQEVSEGFGMGMALPTKKGVGADGIFSFVTGLGGPRRLGDMGGLSKAGTGGIGGLSRKRTFSEAAKGGRLGTSVASRQFVFAAGDEGSRSMGGSNSGAGGGLGRSSTAEGPSKASKGGSSDQREHSLFAQLGAKRGQKSLPSH